MSIITIHHSRIFKVERAILERAVLYYMVNYPVAGRPGSSEVPRNPLTRWDVSSTPANGIFLTKKQKQKTKTKNAQRVEND